MSPEITTLMCERVSACEPSCSCFPSSHHPPLSAFVLPLSSPAVASSLHYHLCMLCKHLFLSLTLSTTPSPLFNIAQIILRFFFFFLPSPTLVTFTLMPLAIQKVILKREETFIIVLFFLYHSSPGSILICR